MERIYTIPVNEAFDASASAADPACGCPLCALYRKLENDEVELALGGSMMEPDVRIRMNERGFCGTHFDKLFQMKNRLGLGLILESHLSEVKKKLSPSFLAGLCGRSGERFAERAGKIGRSCYICDRIEHNFAGMIGTVTLLYGEQEDFRRKLRAQPYFCLPHAARLLEAAENDLPKKQAAQFAADVTERVRAYLDTLGEDVSWFCKKFDYRYGDEPWKNAKDSIERSIRFLSGEER